MGTGRGLHDGCRVTFDRRLLVGETPEEVLRPFRQTISDLAAQNQDFRAEVGFASGREGCHTGEGTEGERFFPAWLRTPD